MSLYVISIIVDKFNKTKLRLFNDIELKYIDVYEHELSDNIKNMKYDSDRKPKITSGYLSRYPLLDENTNTIRNRHSYTVIGYLDIDGVVQYRICDYAGNVTLISKDNLIKHGMKHRISNCKISSDASGNKLVMPIYGDISKIDRSLSCRIDTSKSKLTIIIPYMQSNKLEIPNQINGVYIRSIKNIEIKPEVSALNIKKLVLPKSLNIIEHGLFDNMPNLTEIEILSDSIELGNRAFSGCKSLINLKLNNVVKFGSSVAAGLKNLKTIEFKCRPYEIGRKAFEGCTSLNVNSVIQGVEVIKSKAFAGTSVNRLILPRTLHKVADDAFNDCNRLEYVDCCTDTLSVIQSYKNNNGLFYNSNTVEMELNSFCILNGKIADNVNITRRTETNTELQLKNKANKAKLLGYRLSVKRVISNNIDVSNVISISTNDELKAIVLDLIYKLLNQVKIKKSSYTGVYRVAGFQTYLTIRNCVGFSEFTKIDIIDKYIVLYSKNLIFIPYDRDVLSYYYKRQPDEVCSIIPIIAKRKYYKAIDIAQDGQIRIIYDDGFKISKKYIDYFRVMPKQVGSI